MEIADQLVMENRIAKPVITLLAVIGLISGCSGPARQRHTDLHVTASHTRVVAVARSMLGVPYHYGGRHPDKGFDCSGLVYYTHLQAGMQLPRTSYAQFKSSRPITRKHLIPGDLVFFRIRRNKISHVGIYLGNGRFIHAPSSGKEVSIASMSNPYWQKRFARGGRVF